MTICTISAKEAQHRIDRSLEAQKRVMTAGSNAVDALLWFAEIGGANEKKRPKAEEVFSLQPKIVASGTPHAAEARDYIERAARTYDEKIFADAIDMARRDMGRADDLARELQKGRP